MLNKTNNNNKKYNCRSKRNCLLNGECLTQCLVYKATSKTSSNSLVYYEISEGEFKSRYNNYTNSFRHCQCINEKKLSKYLWKLKNHGLTTIYLGKSTIYVSQSMLVGKNFHLLCWSRHFMKQKNWTDCQRNKVFLANLKK